MSSVTEGLALRPTAIDHIGLKVTDMDKSLHFYCDVLGFEKGRAFTAGTDKNRAATISAGSQKIDLFYREDFVSADKENPVGMDHMCVDVDHVDSADALVDYLRAAGVEVMWGPVQRYGRTSVYVYDPDGVHVELRFKAD